MYLSWLIGLLLILIGASGFLQLKYLGIILLIIGSKYDRIDLESMNLE
jgi:hypothetical protein